MTEKKPVPLALEARSIKNAAHRFERHAASIERSAVFATACQTAVLSGRIDLPPDLVKLLSWATEPEPK